MAGPKPGQKTVLITGCTPGGIGHALCLEYHHKGLYVIATARRPEVLAGLAEMGMSALQLDVTDQDSIQACEEQVATITSGKLDILTNVLGVMATVQAFAGQLVAARGLIVNFASLAAVVPYVFGAAFSASKGAVVSYSRTLRQELAPFGVRVTVVMAGTVRTTIDDGRRSQTLPRGSIYLDRASDLYQWRLGYSQGKSAMDARTTMLCCVGFWDGGDRIGSGMGQYVPGESWTVVRGMAGDLVTSYSFRMNELAARLKDDERQKKLT
ncbi:short chain dehydrogenase [Apiospora hydei]|uniref:Short chain dehydrogenase n=1 Tax=Apiospora hydei TaxID=1337664 RepID=A0ABR1UW35_9PEZI